jgi:hypothetical protein
VSLNSDGTSTPGSQLSDQSPRNDANTNGKFNAIGDVFLFVELTGSEIPVLHGFLNLPPSDDPRDNSFKMGQSIGCDPDFCSLSIDPNGRIRGAGAPRH